MAITAFQKIQCAAVPTADADLANKKYVDDAVANAGGGSGGGASDRLTAGNVDSLAPDSLGQSTYLVAQTAIATEYSSIKTYQIGDVIAYHGELWQRNFASGSGVPPSTGGMMWKRVTAHSLIPKTKGCDLGVVTYSPGSSINLSDYPCVVKIGSSFVGTLGTIGVDFGGITIGGMLSIELHIDCASTRPSAIPIKWEGTALTTVWMNGVLGSIVQGKVNVVRLRYFPGTSNAILDYVGAY